MIASTTTVILSNYISHVTLLMRPFSRWDKDNTTHIFPMTTDMGFCRAPLGPQVEGYAALLKDSIMLQVGRH